MADAIIILKRRVKERSVLRRFFGSAPDPIAFKESDKMEVQEPTAVVPIRRYIPNSLQEIFVSTDFKPGFVQQVQAAIKAAKNLPLDNRLCSYTQALSVLKMMDRVVGRLK